MKITLLTLLMIITFVNSEELFLDLKDAVITYPKVTPRNDMERCKLAYRDGRIEEFWKYVKQYGPNIGDKYSTILSTACSSNDSITIAKLILLGVDINAFNGRAIHSAVSQVRITPLKQLIEAGVDLEIKYYNQTILERAIKGFSFFSNYNPNSESIKDKIEDEFKIIQILIDGGADISAKTSNSLTYVEFIEKRWSEMSPLPHDDYITYKKRMLKMFSK